MSISNTICSIIISSIVCCTACTATKTGEYAPPEFDREVKTNFDLLTSELNFSNVYGIWEYKSYLLVLGAENGNFLHIYDKISGKKQYELLRFGRGPNEINSIGSVRFNQDEVLVIQDYQQGKVIEFRIASLLSQSSDVLSEYSCPVPSWCCGIIPLQGGKLIIRNVGQPTERNVNLARFEVKDNRDSVTFRYNKFPSLDPTLRFRVYSEALYAVSPDERKMLVGTVWGGILETYSIENGMESIATRYFVDPQMDIGRMTPKINENTVLGFSCLYVDNDRIYGAYDCEIKMQSFISQTAENQPLQFNKIGIFDWSGNELECLVTDYNIRSLCVGANNTVYAAVYDNLGRFYLGKTNALMAAAAVTGISANSESNASELLNANVEALAGGEGVYDGALWSNSAGTVYCCGSGNVRDCKSSGVPSCQS